MNVAAEPTASLRGRDFLSAADFSAEEVRALFGRAAELKEEFRATRRHEDPPLVGRTLAMLFQRPSLRTRVTFEAGMAQLGGHAIYLTHDVVLGAREAVRDVARNLDRFVDGIVARTGPHEVVGELAAQARIPVINGLTLREHPCQALADLFTIGERFGDTRGVVLAFVGDGNNVYHSLALLGAALGLEVRLAHPPGYAPNARIVARAKELAGQTGARLVFATEPEEVVSGAAVVYTDAWTSMGQEAETEERRDAFARYQVNARLLAAAGPDALVMHCLPAHRGEEITSDVMDGPRSLILDQSENRLHVQKALLAEVMGRAGERIVSEAIYERYKEALRRGHVAALRDRLDAALVAYTEAAEIAPERALPHASVGSVLVRLGRPEEALAAYTIALLRAPRDESAQAGRAEALAALGQVVEAADSLDRLAMQQETDGKASAALATATRALELAESRTRRKHVETLTAQVGVAGGAMLPEPETDAPVRPATPRPEPEPEPEPAPPVHHWTLEPEPVPAATPEPAPEPQKDGAALSAEAEDRLDAGDPEAARDRLLAAAASHRATGAIDAALDACYMALAIAPADPELHLALAELYLDRGWRGPAADKILLLGRLVDFARDGTIRERVCELVANRFADDPRLTALCA